MLHRIKRVVFFLAFPAFLCGMNATLSVKLASWSENSIRIGKTLKLEALPEDAQEPMWYRFRIRGPGEATWRTVRDYGPQPEFRWAPMGRAGSYDVEMTARGLNSGRTTTAIHRQEVTAAVGGTDPVAYPTDHPLVFLYSAPPCPAGSQMRVAFAGPEGKEQSTPERECDGVEGMHFYLAGLRPSTFYSAQHVIRTESTITAKGPAVEFETPPVDLALARVDVLRPAPAGADGVLVMGTLFQIPTATDLQGNLIWYYPYDLQYLTRPVAGGYFLALLEKPTAGPEEQRFIKFDLAGNTVLETNAARINEQLAARGNQPITSFHHEARELAGGKYLLLAGTERLLTDIQGPGEVDVIGDMILVLDSNLQVEWAWDAFDHLDATRKALADEKCVPGGGGCPAFYLAPTANDWLHGNSLQLTPDGHIIYSARHQDWLIKIDYDNGAGGGGVLWKLGADGDFRIESDDAWPWFSHQHDAQIEWNGNTNRVLLFDNSNARYAADAGANSRGQVFEIDETNRTAKLVLNVDLGAYALALGSAQLLENGHYHFNLGWMPNAASQALEYTRSGELVFQVETGIQQYRSFRMQDLYTP